MRRKRQGVLPLRTQRGTEKKEENKGRITDNSITNSVIQKQLGRRIKK